VRARRGLIFKTEDEVDNPCVPQSGQGHFVCTCTKAETECQFHVSFETHAFHATHTHAHDSIKKQKAQRQDMSEGGTEG